MASGKRSRVRLSLGVEFDNLAAKAAFTSRFEYVRSLLTPAGQRSIDNLGLLSALFDLVEGSVLPSLPVVSRALSGQLPGTSRSSSPVSSVQSFNSNAGKYLLAYLHVQQVAIHI